MPREPKISLVHVSAQQPIYNPGQASPSIPRLISASHSWAHQPGVSLDVGQACWEWLRAETGTETHVLACWNEASLLSHFPGLWIFLLALAPRLPGLISLIF